MKKLPGIIQIVGLIGCILLPLVLVNGLVGNYNERAFYLLYLPFLLMPALACRLLFSGDDSTLGRFFYGIGDFFYRKLSIHIFDTLIAKIKTANWFLKMFPDTKAHAADNDEFIKRLEKESPDDKRQLP